MTSSRRLWMVVTSAVLIATVALQLGMTRWRQSSTRQTRPAIGTRLPSPEVQALYSPARVQLLQAANEGSPCSLIVIVGTHCRFCKRMRVTWPQRFTRWRDSIGIKMPAIWISNEAVDTLRDFFDGYDFGEIKAGAIRSKSPTIMSELGVIGTPTTYLIDASGVLRVGVIGDQLPPIDSARSACRTQ